MKKKVILGAFMLIASLASAQTKVSGTSIGINLGGLVSIVYDDVSTLGLKDNQWRKIREYQSDYETRYNHWASAKHYKQYDLDRKREELYKEIRIQIGNILTVEQREKWNTGDYNYRHYHPYDYKREHHYKKSNKYKNKHNKKHKHKHDDCH